MLDESRLDGVGAEEYRAALRRHAAGVVVVTAAGPVGLTVTSLISLSLEPPLVSFAVAVTASAHDALTAAPTFVVNFLAADQAGIAVRFATTGIDRFAPPLRWSNLATGEPVLLDAPAYLRCAVTDRVPAGDHVLLIGQVLDTRAHRRHEPLLYHEGRYASVRSPRSRWLRRKATRQ